MARIGRPGLSPEQTAELWERWKGGQCASDIGRVLARTKGAIHHVLALTGRPAFVSVATPPPRLARRVSTLGRP